MGWLLVAVGKNDHVIDELRHAVTEPGGRLNINMSSYQDRDRLIFNMGIFIAGNDSLYIET